MWACSDMAESRQRWAKPTPTERKKPKGKNKYNEFMEIDNIYNCDCLEGMSELPTDHKYCIVTDPPFNVGYHYNEYKDNKSEDEYFEWLEQITKGYPVVMIHYPEALYKFAFQIFIGSKIFLHILNTLQPSIKAASSISFGIAKKAWRIRNIPNTLTAKGRIKPKYPITIP